ncbi:hypothetical protein KX729_15200 [Rhizobium sp. XQZ8]|uniref:hypothetical protein n=1 Tax=Rhizobium populisoli TaxID=2859785 RepID=UPI001CA4E984|nr:hypothetical protein [Rhizobium populisoli]MBW6422803.1 hypothetical protein [Rhizobium populisoli]
MPSEELNESLDVEQDQPENGSVYDFLYYDQTRISSFLAQFDPSGHLTNITNNERAHRSRKKNLSTQAAGSAAVVKGSITDFTDTVAEYGKQVTKSYDPRWANALAFLDYLEQENLLNREIEASRIGEIVLIKGDL